MSHHNSRDPERPPASNRHTGVDRRDPPEPPDDHRRRPGSHGARAPRVGVHRGQPTIRLPRVETRDVRRPRALARCTPRVDQGRRRPRFLHARPVVLESAPELFRRAVVLGACVVAVSFIFSAYFLRACRLLYRYNQ